MAASLPAAAQGQPGLLELQPVDISASWEKDRERLVNQQVAHFAAPQVVDLSIYDERWGWELENLGSIRLRLRIQSLAAKSLNLYWDRFQLPEGASMRIRSGDGIVRLELTHADNNARRELWTPPIPGSSLSLEVNGVREEVLSDLQLRLHSVQVGYAGFGESLKSGSCNLDVSCEEAAGWNEQARSVALLSIGGVRFCTGFLVNNTSQDGTPLLMTARHCGITKANAASVVVIWNHVSDVCRRPGIDIAGAGRVDLQHFQTGATLLAEVPATDASLLLLDERPKPEFQVYYAGWDRGTTPPFETVTIHHPGTDAKRISFDQHPAARTSYIQKDSPGDDTHLRVGGWERGTTEGGSSGAPQFNEDGLVVGQLHGGGAACGEDGSPNDAPDWFGRLARSWIGNGKKGGRLSDWLDPEGRGNEVLEGIDGSVVLPSFWQLRDK